MNVGVILVAAGQGSRLGAAVPKALVPLCGRSLVEHALDTSARCHGVTEVAVVAPSAHLEAVQRLVDTVGVPLHVQVNVVAGGPTRSASVARGLAELSAEVGIVLVHDAARALTPVEVFDRVVAHVRAGHRAVIPVLPVIDTVKAVDDAGQVQHTVDRAGLRIVQTPQGFLRETLQYAHGEPGGDVTDDAGMVERLGGTVSTVRGDVNSLKITTTHDLVVATALVAAHEAPV